MLFLQAEIETGYNADDTIRQLYLAGKIMYAHKNLIKFKLKGIILDRIFHLLRDKKINKVPSRTFCEILSNVRTHNLGWRFLVDSVNKLYAAKETDDLFFFKVLSIVQSHFRRMPEVDSSLMKLLME